MTFPAAPSAPSPNPTSPATAPAVAPSPPPVAIPPVAPAGPPAANPSVADSIRQQAAAAGVPLEAFGVGGPAPAPPAIVAATVPPAQPVAPAPSPLRDLAKQRGWDDSAFKTDEELAAALFDTADRAYQTQQDPTFRTYLEQRQQFETWRAQQQPVGPAAAPDRPLVARRPDWDPSWVQYVQKTADGQLKPAPNAPPGVFEKVRAFQAWAQEMDDALRLDPAKALAPLMEEVADRRYEQRMAGYQAHQTAERIIQGNAGWIYAHDDKGQPVRTPTGQQVPSPAGKLYAHFVAEIERMGVRDPNEQNRYASNMVYALVSQRAAQQGAAGASAAATNEQHKQNLLLNAAARAPQLGGSNLLPSVQPEPLPPTTGSLRENLKRAWEATGMTEEQLRAELGVR